MLSCGINKFGTKLLNTEKMRWRSAILSRGGAKCWRSMSNMGLYASPSLLLVLPLSVLVYSRTTNYLAACPVLPATCIAVELDF